MNREDYQDYREVMNSFLGKIKDLRPQIGSIYLFGSHARGLARPDSDYDLLLVVPKKERLLKNKLYEAAVDVLLEKGADISLKIIRKEDFERMKNISAPFIENVLKEGIKIG